MSVFRVECLTYYHSKIDNADIFSIGYILLRLLLLSDDFILGRFERYRVATRGSCGAFLREN